jgi:hypothetical protein
LVDILSPSMFPVLSRTVGKCPEKASRAAWAKPIDVSI